MPKRVGKNAIWQQNEDGGTNAANRDRWRQKRKEMKKWNQQYHDKFKSTPLSFRYGMKRTLNEHGNR